MDVTTIGTYRTGKGKEGGLLPSSKVLAQMAYDDQAAFCAHP